VPQERNVYLQSYGRLGWGSLSNSFPHPNGSTPLFTAAYRDSTARECNGNRGIIIITWLDDCQSAIAHVPDTTRVQLLPFCN